MTRTSDVGVDKTLRVGRDEIRVRTQGEGPPLLLIMGLGGSVELWEPLAAQLSGHRRLIMFDTPGIDGPTRWRYPIKVLASIAEAVARHDGHEQLDVMGVSLGGLVAQELARRQPHLVRRLVLASTCSSPWRAIATADPVAMAILGNPVRHFLPPVNELLSRYVMGGITRRDATMAHQYASIRRDRPPSIAGYYAQMLGTAGFNSAPWLRELSHPTLVLHGTRDPLIDVGNGRLLAARIPDARLETVDGGGHLIIFDQPTECVAAVDPFLDEELRGAPGGRSSH